MRIALFFECVYEVPMKLFRLLLEPTQAALPMQELESESDGANMITKKRTLKKALQASMGKRGNFQSREMVLSTIQKSSSN